MVESNKQLGIKKLPINTEPIIYTLKKQGTITKKGLSKPLLITLGKYAKETNSIEINKETITLKTKISILYKTPKKIVVQTTPTPHTSDNTYYSNSLINSSLSSSLKRPK